MALAGDTMLGRGVAAVLESVPRASLFAPEVVAAVRGADLALLNLECCISTRGERWPDRWKPLFFRAPPAAIDVLTHIGVECVTLANNHALDFGTVALTDTLHLLHAAGIETVGAGANVDEARRPAVLEAKGFRLGVVGATDYPADYAAGPRRPGVAFARLGEEIPDWLAGTISRLDVDAVLVTPHWGPNMIERPRPEIRRAAAQLLAASTPRSRPRATARAPAASSSRTICELQCVNTARCADSAAHQSSWSRIDAWPMRTPSRTRTRGRVRRAPSPM